MKKIKLSKEELVDLLKEFKSVGQVASHLSLPYSTLYAWYKKHNIELLPNCMTIYDELRKVNLSSVHRSVIIGSILGDGSLLKNKKSKNARLQIRHCSKQLGYLKWKKNLLNPFVNKITEVEITGTKVIQGKNLFSTGYWICNTIAHPEITEYYNRYYVAGKKRIISDIIDELDLLALSIWLADNGSFYKRKECSDSLIGSIAACSFSGKEIEMLMCALSKFYKGRMALDHYNNTIYLNGTPYVNDLLDKVTKILPECIHYKFAPQRLMRKTP